MKYNLHTHQTAETEKPHEQSLNIDQLKKLLKETIGRPNCKKHANTVNNLGYILQQPYYEKNGLIFLTYSSYIIII